MSASPVWSPSRRLDCCSTTARRQVVAQSGKADDITMGRFDLLTQTSDTSSAGPRLHLSQNPAEQVYQAVKVLHDFPDRGTEITGVDTGAQFITRDNLADATVRTDDAAPRDASRSPDRPADPGATGPAVRIRGLSRNFGRSAPCATSPSTFRGEVTALLGENGAGKSTC
ncbi:hypothetical protein GCM10023238_32470 [Streptomyces heliomycini]